VVPCFLRCRSERSLLWSKSTGPPVRFGLPRPMIVHPMLPNPIRLECVQEEPYAGKPHVRVCQGERRPANHSSTLGGSVYFVSEIGGASEAGIGVPAMLLYPSPGR